MVAVGVTLTTGVTVGVRVPVNVGVAVIPGRSVAVGVVVNVGVAPVGVGVFVGAAVAVMVIVGGTVAVTVGAPQAQIGEQPLFSLPFASPAQRASHAPSQHEGSN